MSTDVNYVKLQQFESNFLNVSAFMGNEISDSKKTLDNANSIMSDPNLSGSAKATEVLGLLFSTLGVLDIFKSQVNTLKWQFEGLMAKGTLEAILQGVGSRMTQSLSFLQNLTKGDSDNMEAERAADRQSTTSTQLQSLSGVGAAIEVLKQSVS